MDRTHYNEMLKNFNTLDSAGIFAGKKIYLFGHCNASEELAKLFLERNYTVTAILDNNVSKHNTKYNGILVTSPENVLTSDMENTVVCIAARAFDAMKRQLKQLGYTGRTEKLVDYNSFAEYSLEQDAILRKTKRLKRGFESLNRALNKYEGYFRVYCPFQALGDTYNTMAYLLHFLKKRNIDKYVVYAVGKANFELIKMFSAPNIEMLAQKEMDEHIQAVFYTNDKNAYIAHNDKPYFINLAKALKIKMISHEMIYKYGVFGLEKDCEPYKPVNLEQYCGIENIESGKAVILSPYAKSVANISEDCWEKIIRYYKNKDYQIFTNAAGEEETLPDTIRMEAKLSQIQSAVEKAGTFIGLRSGLCDAIKWAKCRKIALYPDCFYSDTEWKMEEMFHLSGWENVVVKSNIDIEGILDS